VIDVERQPKHAVAVSRVEPIANIERLTCGVHAGTICRIHRMQRLDRERQLHLAGIVQKNADFVFDHGLRRGEILACRAAGP
jgi:hypothetical protein